MNNPRAVARDLLTRLDKGPLDLQAALDQALEDGVWDPRDRRLAAELVYGTARWRYRLDRLIRARTGRRIKDLDRPVRTLLRLGAYQLLYMDRIPPSAAVNETVRLAGGNRQRKGFLNGVLRALAEGHPLPPSTDPGAQMAAEFALPEWLAGRWLKAFGPDRAEARARHANTPPPLTLRAANGRVTELALRIAATGATAEGDALVPGALRVAGAPPVPELPGFAEGLFYVQDAAAQWVGALLGAAPGERVLDACAAPGGKTCQLAEAVGPDGEVVAVEVDPGRRERLDRNLARMGADNVRVVAADAATVSDEAVRGPFDRVLVDAPCSGLGVLNRHPEGKWWKSEALIGECSRVQRSILEHLSRMVKPGGRLVYAVCTGEPEETTGVVHGFLSDHPEFNVVSADTILGPAAGPWTDAAGALDTNGNDRGMDGFFAVHLLRQSC